ncbi:MAG: single-stranded-DNA-specific exonuclease RecJ [Patescibacteria group bacterium]
MGKTWQIEQKYEGKEFDVGRFIEELLERKGITSKTQRKEVLSPKTPLDFTAKDGGIDEKQLNKVIVRIHEAINKKQSIVVYADYDADGVTAGAILWETLWSMGAQAMPYVPHRVDEGYGLSIKGIDNVREQFDPSLIITVDHGVTAHEKVAYAKSLGIEVIVTDHHVLPEILPDCLMMHTTKLSGSGVSWFLSKELKPSEELLSLAAIGTVADLLPLIGVNRSIVKYGIEAMRKTKRVGVVALLKESGITKDCITPYSISHGLAPRLNAMGRLEHAIDALRLLCTKNVEKAQMLSEKLGFTNKERQKITEDTVIHAKGLVVEDDAKLLFVGDVSYNQGIIGLVAGKLVEHYYKPSIVVSIGEEFTKASARSIVGFNIVEAIRECQDLLVDVGGHPMAAGFTVATKNIDALKVKLLEIASRDITEEMLQRKLRVDAEIPLSAVTLDLFNAIQQLAPFGQGNYEPVFATKRVKVTEARLVGATGKHVKLKIDGVDAIAFSMGELFEKLNEKPTIDIAYGIDLNVWNGTKKLQLVVKDIIFPD